MTAKEIGDTANLGENASALLTGEMPPSAGLDVLEEHGLYEDAVRFLAHKLPVRGGIEWGVQCVREMQPPERKNDRDEPLAAAEMWLKAPGDPARYAARQAADGSRDKSASTLIAMAVFFSGGSVAPPGNPEVPPPPYCAQKMIAGGVRIAVLSHDIANAGERYRRVLALGRKAEVNP